MWNHYVQWLVQKWIIREIFPYLLTWKPERNKVTYWYLSVRQKVITQGQCLTIIVHKHCVDQCLIMRHLKILHQTWPPLCLYTLSLPDIIACDKVSQAILLVFAYCKWQKLESHEGPWTTLCTTHTIKSGWRPRNKDTFLYRSNLQDMLKKMILANLL